jgi:HEAT repeat protein
MNRYLWVAVGLIFLFVVSLATILLVHFSNKQVDSAISLALTGVATAAAVGSSVFGVIGKKTRENTHAGPVINIPQISSPPVIRLAPGQRDRESSLHSYLRQMRSKITELGMDQRSFVPLTTVAEPITDYTVNSDLIPELEWLSRRAGADYLAAQPKKINLLQIPEKFDQVVLLGEPGSGKTTCLRRLALSELDRVSAWLDDHTSDPSEELPENFRLPLYASLSDWQQGITAIEFLRMQLQNLVGPENHYVIHFDDLLANGHFVLLLDGLNELPGRRPNPSEGRHEQGAEHADNPRLPGKGASFDRREIDLRELACSIGLQSRFVLSCRSHEYFDSNRWQTVRILPMNARQIDKFINVYLDSKRAAELRNSLHENEQLAAISDNPFFLRTIIRIHRPGMQLNSRGQILAVLYKVLMQNERNRTNGNMPADDSVATVIGRIGFRMLAAGKVGNQAPLGALSETEAAAARTLAGTGLIIERGGKLFFLHQIIQEFFAAQALSTRVVRRSLRRLLADKRWSEVVALWCDLDADRLPEKVASCLRARNMPWRRPRSGPTSALFAFQVFTILALMVVAASYFWIWVLRPISTLSFRVSLPAFTALLLLAGIIAIRIAWICMIRHRKIIINSVYVLSAIRYARALETIVASFSSLYMAESAEVARYVSKAFGLMALAHAMRGLESPSWRVRSGCVQILGELARAHPTDSRALETMLAVARAGDPQLVRVLVEGLVHCRSDRVPQALAEILSTSPMNGFTMQVRLSPLANREEDGSITWGEDTVARFENLAKPNRPTVIRGAAFQVMGALRIPGCEERLGAIAADRGEESAVRQMAIRGLGLTQTPSAVQQLVELAESDAKVRKWACGSLQQMRNPSLVTALLAAVGSGSWHVRQAVAVALGVTGKPDALGALSTLAQDKDYDVREAVARALAVIDLTDAIPILDRLAQDRFSSVRKAAVEALVTRYSHLASAVLLSLAEDPLYPDRVRVIRLLGRDADPQAEDRLRGLTADLDRDVRNAAWEAVRQIQIAIGRRRRTEKGAGLFSAVKQRLATRFPFAGFQEMIREEMMAGITEQQAWYRVQARIASDAELMRRYRLMLNAFYYALLTLLVVLIAILVLVAWLLLWSAHSLLAQWPYCVAIVGCGFATFLPGIRRLRYVPGFSVIFVLLRLATYALISVALVGGLIYTWWITLATIAVVGLFAYLWVAGRRRRRRRNVIMALRSAPGLQESLA